MRKKKARDEGGGYYWMDTYGDMVTLLLTFFVLLFSMSSVDQQKWEMLVKALTSTGDSTSQIVIASGEVSVAAGNQNVDPAKGEDSNTENIPITEVTEFDQLFDYLKNYIEQNQLENDIQLTKGEGYTFIEFRNSIFFDGDSAVLKNEGKTVLDFFMTGLINISNDVGEIRTYGHTAQAVGGKINDPIKDRLLSVERATNVLLYMQMKNIVSPEKMVSEGYGQHRPIVPHDGTEATRIKNRRVEIYISKSDIANNTLDQIYDKISGADKKESNAASVETAGGDNNADNAAN